MESTLELDHSSSGFWQTLEAVESFLCAYYGMHKHVKATDYLIEAPKEVSGKASGGHSIQREMPRAAVCLQESQMGQDLFVGIYFCQDLIDRICERSPLIELNDRNLDSFCVLVEELSHFHLICQRARESRSISQLEIEWQGEIDKFLLSAILLAQQNRSPHIRDLQTVLFDSVVFYLNENRYIEANSKAANFWKQAIASGIGTRLSLMNDKFRRLMMLNYHSSLQDKLVFSGFRKVFV